MQIITKIEKMQQISDSIKVSRQSIGMVPTMGYLHDGHKSLIKKARENNDIVVVSVFLNPIQFGPDEDFENYPRDLERDAKICEELGADYVFHPDKDDMYPRDFSTFVVPGESMTNVLCGVSRPGHFRGVCTVLTKLFSIVRPDNAYFGEKDIQQLSIVTKLVSDLNLRVNIIGCPIVREEDGLAKSSRNTYLNDEERKAALVLRNSILEGKKLIDSGEMDTEVILKSIVNFINEEPLAKIDYVEIVDFDTFEKIEKIKDNTIIAMAVYIGKTRLIDNILVRI
ncbi:pantoate--beta-alanine ligase [Peptostreptococcus faecalis]|uniref:pantoate--beta-alanine ligase n=1 Tax=Peptostreptococcus faecalis TaxID=2045015 RepID=UPI000C7B87EE|nr:pantoate--beta-alanine ligase [Peptostreptococcus faecalis]